MKKTKGLLLVLSFFLLTACFGGEKGNKNRLTCTYKSEDESLGVFETKIELDYDEESTLVKKYIKTDSFDFNDDYISFMDITKEDWEASCNENLQGYDICEVKKDGKNLKMIGTIEVKKDREEELYENIYRNTPKKEAKEILENALFSCEK